MRTVECKNCNGRGHVLNPAAIFMPVLGWALAVFEKNNKRGITREECEHCDGKGYIRIRN